jgi:drug/metabolite transporter (DMT)-like permease
MAPTRRAWLQIHFCVVLWGFTAILGKAISLPAFPLVTWRMIIVTAALMFAPRFWIGLTKLPPRVIAADAGIGLVVAAHWLAFYAAIKLSNASVAATCMALAPIFMAFVEPLLVGSRFEVRDVFFGLAVVPGVILVVGGTQMEMRLGFAVGVLSAFFASVFGALNKRLIRYGQPLSVTGVEMAAGAICLIAGSMILGRTESVLAVPAKRDLILLLTLAIACTLVPFALSLVAQRHLSAFAAALAVNMEPVYAIFLAIPFFHEQQQLQGRFYVGVAIILLVVFSHPLLLRPKSAQTEHLELGL